MTVSSASARRDRRLHALGVTPYRLRSGDAAVPADAPLPAQTGAEDARSNAALLPCVVLLPASCVPRDLDRLGRAMHAFGADFARAPRVQVPASGLREAPPAAHAYLAFGQAQARALGEVLDAAVMRAADVVLLDAPDQSAQGAAKQRLWLAMKALRRRLRER